MNGLETLKANVVPSEKMFEIGLEPQDITFYIKDKEVVRLCDNGDFLVRGKKVTNDMELYKGIKEWYDKGINEPIMKLKELIK